MLWVFTCISQTILIFFCNIKTFFLCTGGVCKAEYVWRCDDIFPEHWWCDSLMWRPNKIPSGWASQECAAGRPVVTSRTRAEHCPSSHIALIDHLWFRWSSRLCDQPGSIYVKDCSCVYIKHYNLLLNYKNKICL